MGRIGFAALASIGVAAALALPGGPAAAAVKGRLVQYNQGGTALEGYLAYDTAARGKRPAVVVFPDWMGVTDYAEKRAEKLAGLGYVVFVADLYGKGVHPKDTKEAAAQAGKLRSNQPLLHARDEAALAQLRAVPVAAPAKLIAMGYCFGGESALGMARGGDDLLGVVTFHGDVHNPDPQTAQNIKAHVLVLWGANDPHVNAQAMAGFENEMRATKADWQVITYSNTVHSFTVPGAHFPAEGDAYNPQTDRRSWQAMVDFLGGIGAGGTTR